jgi:hypothetical protein
MSNYDSHAWREFRAAGWVDENNNFNDDWQVVHWAWEVKE